MIVGHNSKRYFKYVAVSAVTMIFSLYKVFGCFNLQQLKVVLMYALVMFGHWLIIRRSINSKNRRHGDFIK